MSQKPANGKVGRTTLSFSPMSTPALFKWRHFLPEIILLNVRWYCRYSLSYRNLEEMMQERGVAVDHSTINRWVLKYAPELDKRIRPYLKPTNNSWRVDETLKKHFERLGSEAQLQSRETGLSSSSVSPGVLDTFAHSSFLQGQHRLPPQTTVCKTDEQSCELLL